MVIPNVTVPHIRKGDNIGVALDLTVPVITYFFNGVKIPGYFLNFNLDGMFFPVISLSAKIRSVLGPGGLKSWRPSHLAKFPGWP